MASLLLIDLSAIFWAKWHSAAGKPIDTAYNYTMGRVRQLAHGYDRVAVCCDVGKSFRAEIDSTYKANRPPKDPAAMGQAQRVVDRLTADAFCVLSSPGFEADDIIATVVRWARSLPVPFDVTIAGCDKDLLQLVEPGVRLHNVNTDAFFGPDEVAAKFEVTPDKVRDVLALAGDTSDNIKGIDGVGWKTAAKLVNRFGDIEGIRAALDANPEDVATPALRQNLLDQWARLDVSKRLVTLNYEAPIDCGAILEDRQVKQIAGDMKWDGDEPAEFDNNGPRAERVPQAPPTPIAPAPEPPQANDAQLVQRPPSHREMVPAPPAAQAATPQPRTASPLQFSLEPSSPKEALAMAAHLYESRLFSNFPNPDAIFAIIVAGRSMGIDAMTALRGMHIIEGKPTLSGAMMVALVLRSGKAEYFELVKSDGKEAIYATKRVGGRREIEMGFTIQDAEAAQLLKPPKDPAKLSNWLKYPRTMLRWRAATELCRAVYPDVVSNIYTPDELADGADVVDAEFLAAERAA